MASTRVIRSDRQPGAADVASQVERFGEQGRTGAADLSLGSEMRGEAFAINGRFMGQKTTGVQRYAREMAHALNRYWSAAGVRGQIMMTRSAQTIERYDAIDVVRLGPLDGHLWEQAILPLRCRLPLLNLCNTAPLARHRQIVCMHDANVFIQPQSYSAAFRLTYQLLLPRLARTAARVTSVSKASAQQLAAYLPIAARQIEILPNGHEHVFRWDPAASAISKRLSPHRPFVLLLGSRAKHKNADLILDRAQALDDLGLDLVVAGGGADIFARSTDVHRSNIRYLGTVSDDDLAYLYGNALCLAFPSFTEGFGLPIVEAMALGCPVISSDRASMPEVCGQAALLASPDDGDAWLKHFAALAGSRSLRSDLRDRGRHQAQKFSWAASARGYIELMRDAA